MIKTREATLLVAIVSTLAIWWVWGSVNPLPLIEDEYSYVLQSHIFATGHWTAPAPPIPEFFQQAHVLNVGAVASKFPPGHALLMGVGSLFGAPALIPLLLTGLTAALLFSLVRRVANGWVATLAWLAWLGDPINLRFRAAYFSEVTSGAMWVIAFWALLEWRDTRRTRWLLGVAAAIGWGAITRPLTMLAFAVPVGIVVIRDVVRFHLWRDLGAAVALGIAILGIIPVWSAETTGNWRLTPISLYQRDYLPYDKPGFGVDSTAPALALMPVNKYTYAGFYDEHKVHTPGNLPRIALDRLRVLAHDEWAGLRIVLVPFVIIGLWSLTAPTVFALMCSLALFVGYLSYGHWAQWTIYYFEALPPLSLLAALGAWRLRSRHAYVLRAAVLLFGAVTANELYHWHLRRAHEAAWPASFHEMLGKLPMHQAVLFVHYAPRLGPHSLVAGNSVDVMHDSIWIVNDLGPRDAELMRYAGQRVPLIFHEDGGALEIDRALLGLRR